MKWVTPSQTIMVAGLPHSPSQGAVLVTNAQADHYIAMKMVAQDQVVDADEISGEDRDHLSPGRQGETVDIPDDHPAVTKRIAELGQQFDEAFERQKADGDAALAKALEQQRTDGDAALAKALEQQRIEQDAAFDTRVAEAVKTAVTPPTKPAK